MSSAGFMRAAKRRRSSHGLHLITPKAGVYGASSTASTSKPQLVEFAPNVTPISYEEHGDSGFNLADYDMGDEDEHLFPAAQDLGPPEAKRRRQAPGRRRSQGYIPRPANAFILFRRDFVYQKGARLPDGIDVRHSTLSKIIGSCWRSLPQSEKNMWKAKAERVRMDHIAENPGYKYQPRQKGKAAAKQPKGPKAKSPASEEDEANRKCEEVAQLLMEGKKGDQLCEALKGIEERPAMQVHLVCPQPTRKYARKPIREHRRSSSVPLPDGVGQFFVQPTQPTYANNAFLTGDQFQFGRRRSSSVDHRYLPAPSGEIMFNNPFAPASTVAPRPSLSPSSSVGDLRPMDTSMFDPRFMKAAEQNTFALATESYPEHRLAPHEIPSANNYIPIDPVLLEQSSQMMSEHASFAPQFNMPSVPTFHSNIPTQIPMTQSTQMGETQPQDMFTDLWKSFTSGKSFSMDNNHNQYMQDDNRMNNNGWYEASSTPEFAEMINGSSSNSEFEGSFDVFATDAQQTM